MSPILKNLKTSKFWLKQFAKSTSNLIDLSNDHFIFTDVLTLGYGTLHNFDKSRNSSKLLQ
jgi:hypothetical protein